MNTTFPPWGCAGFIMPGSSRAALAQYRHHRSITRRETTKPIGNSLEKEKHVQVCV